MELKLHYYQKELIHKLSLTPQLRFNELLIDGLESEHMNYHLKQLIEADLVTKNENYYELSDKGKDYSNLLDENTKIVEKQPKTSIIIKAVRKNKVGEIEHLLNKRLRQPYYGKVGHLTGKVRFCESLKDAAKRELYEETGLTAQSFELEQVYRKLRKREDGEWIQDVMFFIFFIKDVSGALIEKTPFQENFWITKEVVTKRKDLDLFDDLTLDDRYEAKPLTFSENVGDAQGY